MLVLLAGSSRARIAAAVYALSLVSLFGVSAIYHRVNWASLRARLWMRRLDHSMIFMMIAGTYTPFALLVLHGTLALAILIVMWSLALAGTAFNMLWINVPKWLLTLLYLAIGWASVVALPQLARAIPAPALGLLLAGGALYTAGAVIYAIRRPDPAPTVFGYHEIFHALVVLAAALQYAVIAVWVLPG